MRPWRCSVIMRSSSTRMRSMARYISSSCGGDAANGDGAARRRLLSFFTAAGARTSSHLQHQVLGALEILDHLVGEVGADGSVDHPVIEREREVHHLLDDDLVALADHRALAHLVHAHD